MRLIPIRKYRNLLKPLLLSYWKFHDIEPWAKPIRTWRQIWLLETAISHPHHLWNQISSDLIRFLFGQLPRFCHFPRTKAIEGGSMVIRQAKSVRRDYKWRNCWTNLFSLYMKLFGVQLNPQKSLDDASVYLISLIENDGWLEESF